MGLKWATRFALTRIAPMLWCAIASSAVHGLESIRFMGMHGDKANLRIDRRTALIGVGDTRLGVTVLSASREEVIVQIGSISYLLARRSSELKKLADTVTIERQRGMFYVQGMVNGRATSFVVDTGASLVVLSRQEATRLRLRYTTHRPVRINTASGNDLAYLTTLQSLRVGGITLSQVPTLITRGNAPATPLLGNSFLRQLRVTQEGEIMQISR